MKTKQVHLNSILENVASRFHAAIWRKKEVGRVFDSVKKMKEAGYNLANANYDIAIEDEDTDEITIVRKIRNGRMDGYGRRY